MSQWVERVLDKFPADLARLWIAVDPDDVLLDEQILSGLRERSFEVLPYEDPVVFRADFEERFRAAWDKGERGPAGSLVLHLREGNAAELPWDYLRQGRRVNLSLVELLPKLSPGVVRQIGTEFLEPLFDAQSRFETQVLNDSGTKEFALTHIFRISAHLISGTSDLWRELLRLHNRGAGLPQLLAAHVANILGAQAAFKGLPIGELFSSKSLMLRVVQSAWYRYFEKRGITGSRIGESAISDEWTEVEIPFEHPDIRAIIHLMFVEGALQPLQVAPSSTKEIPEWGKSGIVPDPGAMRTLVADGVGNLVQSLPMPEASYRDWIQFARGLGEVLARFHGLDSERAEGIKDKVDKLQSAADERLRTWVGGHFSDLSSLPIVKGPVMVHHIPRFLSMRRSAGEEKIALLVFDGLAMDQWIQIRDCVANRSKKLGFDEGACFAWLPTLTSVSRQALLSGLKPREFANSIETTAQEPALWSRFWQDQGLRANEVLYRKGIKRNDDLGALVSEFSGTPIKVAGIVVDTVDEIVHGAVLGKRGIASLVTSWCETGFVDRLFTLLLNNGFNVYLTADHGNVEAVGQGRPNQGVAPELKGERVRTYSSEALAADSAAANANTYRLDIAGLPAGFMPLFASGRSAFVPQGEQVVVHGGISVEELFVPFVKVGYVS